MERNDKSKTFRTLMDSLFIENEQIVHSFLIAVDKIAKSSDKTSDKFKLTQPIIKIISNIFYKYI